VTRARWLLLGVLLLATAALAADLVGGARPAASSGGIVAVAPEVRLAVQQAGRARVIVELRLPAGPFVAEGRLASDAVVVQQRQDIASVQSQVLAKLASTGRVVIHKYASVPYLALEVDPAALAALEAAGFHVTRVLADELAAPGLAQSGPLVGADQAAVRGFDGAGTVVAVLDTGIEVTHPFLAGKILEEACFSSNFASAGASTVCPNGGTQQTGPGSSQACSIEGCDHGTHVTGTAVGDGAPAGQPFSGIARGAGLISVQIFSRFDSTTVCAPFAPPCVRTFSSDQLAALQRVFDLRTRFRIASVNMSLGGGRTATNCDSDPLKPIIDNLRSVGIATVIAAGNDGFRSEIGKPACISSAVSVGSTTKTDAVSSFSNAGPILSLFAPGSSIRSSVPGGAFANFNGTSMATPHVAGAFAVLRQAAPNASVTALLAALLETGLPVTDQRSGGSVVKPRIRIDEALSRFVVASATLTVARAGAGSGTVGSSPGGIACGPTCSATFAGGTVVTLTATPSPGSAFAGWSGGGCSGTGPCTLTLSESKTVTATFNMGGVSLAVVRAGAGSGTVTSSPAGISCGTVCSGSFAANTSVTLTATPSVGSTFAGWSGGGCSGTGSCTVTLTGATTVTATFDAQALPGDLRSSPIAITAPFSEFRQTENYTAAPDDPVHSCTGLVDGRTVWYRFTPANAGRLIVDTFGSDYDTVAAVFLASSLTEVPGGCNDDFDIAAGDLTSRVEVNLAANTTYLIAIAAYGTTRGGRLALAVTFAAQPPQPGDERPAPIAITSTPFADTRNVRSHTVSDSDPIHSCTGLRDGRTVWYSFTPTSSGTATLSTAGSNYDTVLTVHLAATLAEIACNDDVASEDLTSRLQVALDANVPYMIEVSAYGTSPGGTLVFSAAFATAQQILSVAKVGTGTGTVTSAPAGISCGATCSAGFGSGAVVTLTAAPAAGSVFAGWSGGGCSGTGPCTVTMNASVSVMAMFMLAGSEARLAAAVLPTSRSVQINTTATVFATIINAGATTATGCQITPAAAVPVTVTFQATNPSTNALTGTANTPVTIAAGASQSFLLSLTPTAALNATEVPFNFLCANAAAAPILSGLNTVLLTASATLPPDVIALAATASNDGVVTVPGASGTGVFAVATANVGARGTLTVSADTAGASLPLTLALCQTNPATGGCISAVGPSVTTVIEANATPTFAVFIQGQGGTVAFDPGANRVFVRFRDATGGTVRGSTSVAVRTSTP
jgi:hypothetical protein